MSLTDKQIAFEKDWARRWLAGTRSLKPELWVDPFYQDDAAMVRGELPTLKGITAIRQSIAEVCQLFTLFDASNVSVLVDEEESRLVILCDITMSLAPDPEQKKIKTSAAIVIKKALGVEAEKMSEEEAILDRTALARRLTELGMVSPAQDAE